MNGPVNICFIVAYSISNQWMIDSRRPIPNIIYPKYYEYSWLMVEEVRFWYGKIMNQWLFIPIWNKLINHVIFSFSMNSKLTWKNSELKPILVSRIWYMELWDAKVVRFWPLSASRGQILLKPCYTILNKFIAIKFSAECMVLQWCCPLQQQQLPITRSKVLRS